MDESVYEQISACAEFLKVNISPQEMASIAVDKSFSEESLAAVADVFSYLRDRKKEAIIKMLLRLSRLPLKEPKTFQSFDFSHLHENETDKLKELSSLSALYAHRNLSFIGPHGVGKTHLAMAYGHACCEAGLKAYFIKATELNQKLLEARRTGREVSIVKSFVKYSCLIIDEIGRCVFDKENTRMFFDIIDRRYNKEGPSTMIFTSNKSPDTWGEFFSEDSTLLCALDRIFDTATVFTIKGSSYRGRRCETVSITAGDVTTMS